MSKIRNTHPFGVYLFVVYIWIRRIRHRDVGHFLLIYKCGKSYSRFFVFSLYTTSPCY